MRDVLGRPIQKMSVHQAWRENFNIEELKCKFKSARNFCWIGLDFGVRNFPSKQYIEFGNNHNHRIFGEK